MRMNEPFYPLIFAVDVRNDIYITINHGEFKKGTKTSEKNVEVTMGVCNHKGAFISVSITGVHYGTGVRHVTTGVHHGTGVWHVTTGVHHGTARVRHVTTGVHHGTAEYGM